MEFMDMDNLNEIADKIYSLPPKESNSIELELDVIIDKNVENIIFNIIYLITFKGIKILYGEGVELLKLTRLQYETVQKYVASYGYGFKVTANDIDYSPWDLMDKSIQICKYNIYFDKLQK